LIITKYSRVFRKVQRTTSWSDRLQIARRLKEDEGKLAGEREMNPSFAGPGEKALKSQKKQSKEKGRKKLIIRWGGAVMGGGGGLKSVRSWSLKVADLALSEKSARSVGRRKEGCVQHP